MNEKVIILPKDSDELIAMYYPDTEHASKVRDREDVLSRYLKDELSSEEQEQNGLYEWSCRRASREVMQLRDEMFQLAMENFGRTTATDAHNRCCEAYFQAKDSPKLDELFSRACPVFYRSQEEKERLQDWFDNTFVALWNSLRQDFGELFKGIPDGGEKITLRIIEMLFAWTWNCLPIEEKERIFKHYNL